MRRKRRQRGRTFGEAAGVPIDFRHEPEKFGNPLQDWSITDKEIWMLYVLKNTVNANGVTGPQLAATFNQNFKQAKTIRPSLVSRELGKAKVKNPALIGEDKEGFYLTNEGEKYAEQLIQNVLNPAK